MQTGRLGAAEIASQTENVVYHLINTNGANAVVTLNVVNTGVTTSDVQVGISTTDSLEDAGWLADEYLEPSDVFLKQGIMLSANDRLIVRSFNGNLAATAWGTQSVLQQQAVAAPTPYTIPITRTLTSATASADEPGNISITLTTTGLINGTTVPYTITGVSSADIDGASLTGSFTINNNVASANFTVTADETPEGAETFTLTLDGSGEFVNVTINDTSNAPPPVPITGSGGTKTSASGFNVHSFTNTGSSTFTIVEE